MPTGSLLLVVKTTVTSAARKLAVKVSLTDQGSPMCRVERDGKIVLRDSKLGLVRDDADFSKGLKFLTASAPEKVVDRYELPGSKRLLNRYAASRQTLHFAHTGGGKLDVIFQVSNDGAAFRYRFPETDAQTHALKEEVSSFHFLPETKAWLQPMLVAKTGFAGSNPSYEEYQEMEIGSVINFV